ncbi:MAG: DUF4982 domain-containing protein [Opitutae bacterium]|nr:DUF4982 domain-containing protein [Opitutae bacterium]
MKSLSSLVLAAALAIGASAAEPRERLSFNDGWKFARGDHPDVGASLDYERVRLWVLPTGDELLNYLAAPRARSDVPPGGRPIAYARPDFNDGAWRALTLPHDWAIKGPFDQSLSGETGKLPYAGVGWYRKKFTLPASDAGRRVHLEFDGAMSYALVWCNGEFVGGWPYGYTSWRVDLTRFVKPGAENTLAVRLDNPRESSRWYPGAGLYRNVWLTKTGNVAVARWGVAVTTPQVSAASALVNVAVTLDNLTTESVEVQAAVRLFAADEDGRAIGEPIAESGARAAKIPAGRQANVAHALAVASPKLWSLRERHRYVAETRVLRDGKVVDEVRTPFGIRSIAISAEQGFLLNGERVPLNGVCNHHDLGALGAAINVRALERQLEILREMGCNAIRTSHNPPAPELLELCDRMGFVVMVEAFDAWRISKKRDDYSRVFDDWHEKDLRAMVRRDRNHPCVIQWSIGNETRELFEADGWKLAAHLAAIVREEDRTRPVVAGMNNVNAPYMGFQHVLDVVGYNYKPDDYAKVRARYPHLVLMGSETASTVSSRGEYFFPVSNDKAEGRSDFQVSSYDLYAPRWALPPDVEWKGLDENPPVLGEFVWTGFDYLGEPTPFNADSTNLLNFADPAARERAAKELAELGKIRVPSRSSYFGIVDLAGFPKDRFYLYQSRWRPDLPMAHILPHWNWPERVGQVTPVHVYTSGDEAELFLNGQSLGRKKRGPLEYRFRWDDVKYQPGALKVVTYKHGQHWADAVVRTTGPAAAVRLRADRTALRADGSDLVFVTAEVVDAQGLAVPRAKPLLKFFVTGPADLAATDNGDPTSHVSFQSPERAAFNGVALIVVRPRAGAGGAIKIAATSEGLTPSEIEVLAK